MSVTEWWWEVAAKLEEQRATQDAMAKQQGKPTRAEWDAARERLKAKRAANG